MKPGFRRELLTGAAFGAAWSVCSLFAFAPVKLWGLAFVAPLAAVWCAARPTQRPKTLALGFGFGASLFWGATHFWVASISVAGWPPLTLYLSLCSGLGVLLGSALARNSALLGGSFGAIAGVAAIETLRARLIWDGYPWFFPAQPLIDVPALGWAGAWLGLSGLSVVMLFPAGAVVAWRLREKALRPFALLAIAAAVFAGGAFDWSRRGAIEAERTVRIAAVQTNLPQTLRGGWGPAERLDTMRVLMDQSEAAAGSGAKPDLVVWPETLFPGDHLLETDLRQDRDLGLIWFLPDGSLADGIPGGSRVPPESLLRAGGRIAVPTDLPARLVRAWQADLGVPLMLGASGWSGYRVTADASGAIEMDYDDRFNSVHLLDGGRVEPRRYDKQNLTPFGEVMPYISAWGWLEQKMLAVGAQGMAFDLAAGTDPAPFELAVEGQTEPVRVATPICFEATEPWVMRSLAFDGNRRRADVFVQLTNEGWFGSSDAMRTTHADLVRWQAMLLATPLIRSTNTGLTLAIDGRGRLLEPEAAPQTRSEGYLVAELPLAGRSWHGSPYAARGAVAGVLSEWFGWLAVAIGAAGLLVRKKNEQAEARGSE